MACQSCTGTQYTSAYYSAYTNCNVSLNACSSGCKEAIDSACVVYTGPAFVNIPLDSNTCVETIISTIDTMLSAVTGNYSSYNTFCLETQNTQQEFVETISEYVCDTRTTLNTVISTTIPTAVTTLQNQINTLKNPALTSCATLGIITSDTSVQVYNKLITGVCNIYTQLDLSSANWNQCFTIVGDNPETPLEAVNALLGQICLVKASITNSVLPTFDNTSTCLPSPTSTDSLQTTVIKIRDLTCTKPSLDINALTFGCTTKPSSVATDLQGTLQSILTKLNTMSLAFPSFDPDYFATSLVNPSNTCSGIKVSLAEDIAPSDRLVAANNADTVPGTLIDKIDGAGGITVSVVSGQLIIDGTGVAGGGSSSDGKVKANTADPTADFLDVKTKGVVDDSGLSLTTSYDSTDHRLAITGGIDIDILAQKIIDAIGADEDLKAALCNLISTCPISCAPPTNVTVTPG